MKIPLTILTLLIAPLYPSKKINKIKRHNKEIDVIIKDMIEFAKQEDKPKVVAYLQNQRDIYKKNRKITKK